MSAVLQVYQSKQQIARHTVGKERFIIGRSKRCNLPVDEDLVSREHAAIVPADGGYWIEDLGSRNGTRVNGNKIARRQRLQTGDSVAIGSVEILFRLDEEHEVDGGATIAHAGPEPELTPSQKVRKKAAPGRWQVRLRVAEGYLKGETFENWEGSLRIGRKKTCEVPLLSDDYVSQEHAEIVSEGERYFIVDLDSENGTFVNSRRLPPRERKLLVHGNKIRAGKESVLVFELIDADKQRRTRRQVLWTTLALLIVATVAVFLRPPDLAGEHLAAAEIALRKGDIARALEECRVALKIDQNRREALALKRELEIRLKAEDLYGKANAFAKAGKSGEAMKLAAEVLRISPKHAEATKLKTILEAIQLAGDALMGQNWSGAISELEGARARFPDSEVVATMLKTAKQEQMSSSDLKRSRQFLSNNQQTEAEEFASKVPEASAYYPEAKRVLQLVAAARGTGSAMQGAMLAYRDRGDLDAALREVQKGLDQSPSDSRLLQLRSRIQSLAPLLEPLTAAERLGPASTVESLLEGLTHCRAVLNQETEPLNYNHRRASNLEKQIREWLKADSERFAADAEQFEAQHNDKEACRHLLLALKADSANEAAAKRLEGLRARVLAECREAYQKGYSLEGSGRPSEAREYYIAVTNKGLPDLATSPSDDYYRKASQRLKQLGNR
jgi:pSer/pThr/pTyr-binding forkhead associated (FHA) protein